MNPRPLINLFPERIQESIFYRFLRTSSQQKLFSENFRKAPLRYARGVHMYDLIVGDVISGCIASTGFFELTLTREIAALAREGGTFLDVGANLGYYSLLWCRGNARNRTIAVEASPRNQKAIRVNFEKNGFADKLTLISKAAGDTAKTVFFDPGPEEQTGWGEINNETGSQASIPVEMVRLDEILPDEPIDVMKIETQGADTLVLKGCRRLLEKGRIKRIYFMQNEAAMERLGVPLGEAQAILKSHGYNCRLFGNAGTHAEEWLATRG